MKAFAQIAFDFSCGVAIVGFIIIMALLVQDLFAPPVKRMPPAVGALLTFTACVLAGILFYFLRRPI